MRGGRDRIKQGAPAVQREDLPGHEAGTLGGQELNRVGQFTGGGDAAQRGVVFDLAAVFAPFLERM